MKKILITMILALIVLVSHSQNKVTYDKYLSYEENYIFYNFSVNTTTQALAQLTTTDTTWSYAVWKETDAPLNVYVDMLLDSTGGTANNVTVYLQNKKFLAQDWETVDSVVWDGSGSKVVSFEPGLSSLTFNADSTITKTASNQNNLGMYTRIYILGADNTLLADIKRLNMHFIKP